MWRHFLNNHWNVNITVMHVNFKFNFRRKTVKFADYPELRLKTLDSSFKGGIIQPLLEVIFLNQQNYKTHTFNVLDEYLIDVQIVNYFPKNSYLIDSMNVKIGEMKAAGLVNLWMEKYIDKSYIRIKLTGTEAKVMKIQQLMGGFEVLFIGICTSTVIFFAEKLAKYKKIREINSLGENTFIHWVNILYQWLSHKISDTFQIYYVVRSFNENKTTWNKFKYCVIFEELKLKAQNFYQQFSFLRANSLSSIFLQKASNVCDFRFVFFQLFSGFQKKWFARGKILLESS